MIHLTLEVDEAVVPEPSFDDLVEDIRGQVNGLLEKFENRLRAYVRDLIESGTIEELVEKGLEGYKPLLKESFVDDYIECIEVEENGSVNFSFRRWRQAGYDDALFWEIEYGGNLPTSAFWRLMRTEFEEWMEQQ